MLLLQFIFSKKASCASNNHLCWGLGEDIIENIINTEGNLVNFARVITDFYEIVIVMKKMLVQKLSGDVYKSSKSLNVIVIFKQMSVIKKETNNESDIDRARKPWALLPFDVVCSLGM